jgi:hypothetical protein
MSYALLAASQLEAEDGFYLKISRDGRSGASRVCPFDLPTHDIPLQTYYTSGSELTAEESRFDETTSTSRASLNRLCYFRIKQMSLTYTFRVLP